jgi:hypothetical protein
VLFYHPAFDAYHCMFRSLVILDALGDKWTETEKLRILDFYFLFPREIASIRLSPIFAKEKNVFSKYPQYEAVGNPEKVFYRLEGIFENTLKTLAASQLIEWSAADEQRVRISNKQISAALREAITVRENQARTVLDFLINRLHPLPLRGDNGLKHRTNLLPISHDRN